MTIVIHMPEGDLDADPGRTIEDIVRSSGQIPDSFLFVVSGRPVPMDTVPEDGSEVRAVRVASGG